MIIQKNCIASVQIIFNGLLILKMHYHFHRRYYSTPTTTMAMAMTPTTADKKQNKTIKRCVQRDFEKRDLPKVMQLKVWHLILSVPREHVYPPTTKGCRVDCTETGKLTIALFHRTTGTQK